MTPWPYLYEALDNAIYQYIKIFEILEMLGIFYTKINILSHSKSQSKKNFVVKSFLGSFISYYFK